MIEVKNLKKVFSSRDAEVSAVDGVSFKVPKGSLFTLLGPSGCGKSTTLRCIAGLEKPDEGEIVIGGETLSSTSSGVFIPPYKRNIGMVFQSYAVWPHLTVFENVAYPLRMLKRPRREIQAKVRAVLETVGLAAFENRPAPQLSGGQQQRVALARALVKEPEILLLDEPLSNLDAKLRERMRHEIADLLRRLQITSVYVTHDQAEALSISDHVVVMSDGRIVEEGAPKELYLRPRTPFVADFVGISNLLEGKLLSTDSQGLAQADFNGLKVYVETDGAGGKDALRISIRPENIHLSKDPLALPNCWQGKVRSATFLGEMVDYQLEVSGQILRSRTHPSFEAGPGDEVFLGIDPKDCVIVA